MASPGGQGTRDRRTYKKEFSLIVDVENNKSVSAGQLIREVEARCGLNTIYACVPKGMDQFEITVSDQETSELLAGGIEIDGKTYSCMEVSSRTVVVSFIHLPGYVSNKEIYDKLWSYGVEPMSDIKRRFHPGTNVADGTRFVRVKFPPNVVSLPYSMRFSSGNSSSYFRVVHDNQKKVCSICLSDEHLFKDCPDFKCFHCGLQGHVARTCMAPTCKKCKCAGARCFCTECESCGNLECSCAELPESNKEPLCDTCGLFCCVCDEVTHSTSPQGATEVDEIHDQTIRTENSCDNTAHGEEGPMNCDQSADSMDVPNRGDTACLDNNEGQHSRTLGETASLNDIDKWETVTNKRSSKDLESEGELDQSFSSQSSVSSKSGRRRKYKPTPNLSRARRVTPYNKPDNGVD